MKTTNFLRLTALVVLFQLSQTFTLRAANNQPDNSPLRFEIYQTQSDDVGGSYIKVVNYWAAPAAVYVNGVYFGIVDGYDTELFQVFGGFNYSISAIWGNGYSNSWVGYVDYDTVLRCATY